MKKKDIHKQNMSKENKFQDRNRKMRRKRSNMSNSVNQKISRGTKEKKMQ
jgi:hypothetical protein